MLDLHNKETKIYFPLIPRLSYFLFFVNEPVCLVSYLKVKDIKVGHFRDIQREFLKTRFSRCMLYRHNAAMGTD